MMRLISLILVVFTILHANAHSHRGYIVKYRSFNKGINSFGHYKWIKDPKNLPTEKSLDIEYIEPNYIYHQLTDEKFSSQWALDNRGLNSGDPEKPGIEHEDISALKAWEISTGDKKTIVAIIDSGIDLQHPDLKENLWVNTVEQNGKEGVDDDHNGIIDDIYGVNFIDHTGDIQDDDGHGTHCAGIIGAKHNEIGIRGVLDKVQLLSLKFLDAEGNGETIHAIEAIKYAVDHGVKVISNSWGGGPKSRALFEAIQYAQKHGVIFVAAAGNTNNDNDQNPIYPSSYELENIISVGSSNAYGKKAKMSNYGENSVDLLAPGESILSTYPGGKYKRISGTSMAAPYVAGTIALMLSVQPKMDPIKLKETLLQSVDYNSNYRLFSQQSGRLNAYKALENLD